MKNPEARSELRYRLIFAPLLVGLMVGVFLLDYYRHEVLALRFIMALVCGISFIEFSVMCAKKGHRTARIAGVIALLAFPGLWAGLGMPKAVWFLLQWSWAIYLLYLLTKLTTRFKSFTPESASLSFLGYMWIALLPLGLTIPAAVSNSPTEGAFHPSLWYLFIFFCSKGSDMAAYIFGKMLGRRKMAPLISPNKTWEGAIAGGIAGTAAGMAFLMLSPLREAYGNVPVAALLVYSLLVTIASQMGDLVESAIKRWAGVKDSGRLLPSLGGMLDMADSFFLSVPVAYLASEILTRLF